MAKEEKPITVIKMANILLIKRDFGILLNINNGEKLYMNEIIIPAKNVVTKKVEILMLIILNLLSIILNLDTSFLMELLFAKNVINSFTLL